MHIPSFSRILLAIVALSSVDNAVVASPVRRADSSTTSLTSTSTSSSTSSTSSGATSSASSSSSSTGAGTTTAASATSTNTSPAATDTDRYSPKPTEGSYIECHDSSSAFPPFCQPNNNSDVYVGDKYYVTWDANYFKVNTTIEVLIDYTDPEGGGRNVWKSAETPNAYGFVTVAMDASWLNRHTDYNNLTFSIIQLDKTPSKKPNNYPGPTVRLTNKPALHYAPSPETPKPNKASLAIGLPVALGGAAFIIIGVCLWNSKHRKIGLGNIMGNRKGYGVGKSKRQRVNKTGAIKLTDTSSRSNAFRDETTQPGHFRDTSLGSLVSDGADERTQRNAFRAEVERQRTGM